MLEPKAKLWEQRIRSKSPPSYKLKQRYKDMEYTHQRVAAHIFLSFLVSMFALFSIQSGAYQVEPMIHTMEPSGNASMMQLKVTNTSSSALALEFIGQKVSTDEQGNVSREEEYEDLMIFPMQASVPPGRSQVVQVRYVGDSNIRKGKVYAVKVEQLPVAVGGKAAEGASTQVKIGLSFLSHLLVQPANAKPEIVFAGITKQESGGLGITVENVGMGTALLKEMRWTVYDQDNQAKEISIESIDFGSFGAQIPGAPKRMIKIKPEALEGFGAVAKVIVQ